MKKTWFTFPESRGAHIRRPHKILSAGALFSLLLCAQNTNSLSGRVTSSTTGLGIDGVRVRVCPTDASGTSLCGTTHYQATTDLAGDFRIAAIPDVSYTVVTLGPKNGFTPNRAGDTESFGTVTVSGDSRLDLHMTPFASVRGRVLDPDGKPAAGITVRLVGPDKVTNENGEFVFKSVAPSCCLTLAAMPKPQPPGKDSIRIVTTYYPSVVDSAQVAKIAVGTADLTFDIRRQTARARAIRGVVIGMDGKPAPNSRIIITKNESGPAAFIRGLPRHLPSKVEAAAPVTTENGAFVFPSVPEGEWMLRANQAGGSGVTRVTVSARDGEGSDIQDVEIHLVRAFFADVTADWGDAPPPPPQPQTVLILASLIPLDSQLNWEGFRPPDQNPSHSQRVPLATGRYLIVEGRGMPGFYAAAAMLNGRDVLGQVVELSGPVALKMIYKTNGGSVRGTVEKGAGATVIVVADATPHAQLGYSGKCDANGAFTIPDLPPGDYTAAALSVSDPGDTLRPEFASALERDGKRVKVEDGSIAQADLRLSLP